MTILDTLPRRKRGPVALVPDAPKAPDIAAKLAQVRAEYDRLVAAIPGLSLAVELGGAADQLAVAKARRDELETRLADLEAAHTAAAEADALAQQRARAAMYRHKVSQVKKHLAERDEAAEKLARHLQGVTDAWREMWTAGRKARQALTTEMGTWPTPSLIDARELGPLVFKELWRLGGVHPATPVTTESLPAFAGMKAPGIINVAPVQQPVMLDAIKRASSWVIDVLEGRSPAPKADARARGPETGILNAAPSAIVVKDVAEPATPRQPTPPATDPRYAELPVAIAEAQRIAADPDTSDEQRAEAMRVLSSNW
jgi:hypothetical protein